MRHILLISGKDSLATAIVQTRRAPDLPYELVHNETGWDLPETLEWIERCSEFLKRPVIKCGDDLTEVSREQKCLPLPQRRFCTKLAKIRPLQEFLGADEATIYYGLRADEPDRVGYQPPTNHHVCYPLRECGMGLTEVWQLCSECGLLPPAYRWQWIEDRVRELLGKDQWLLDRLPEWERRSLLAWRSRDNCDRCFYARLYERIGLYEHHPTNYEDSCQLEESLAHGDEFTWIGKGYRLRELPARAAEIKEKRARAIVKYLRTTQVRSLFDDDEITRPDDLVFTSCGLLCGK